MLCLFPLGRARVCLVLASVADDLPAAVACSVRQPRLRCLATLYMRSWIGCWSLPVFFRCHGARALPRACVNQNGAILLEERRRKQLWCRCIARKTGDASRAKSELALVRCRSSLFL
uniref:Secreted protein n=1 Tax=Setaria viridis TaxID=4556 RepID=A0A4U6ULZ3_SETVI|nr:hypothetical protein SEVIR_5G307950v2 [Setaria viridis]